MAARKSTPFQPVVMFTPETEADKLAVRMVYTLQEELRASMFTDRGAKQTIGVSEIGDDCLRCLARKLSQTFIKEQDPNWQAHVGTLMHTGFEEHFGNKFGRYNLETRKYEPINEPTDEQPAYHMETRLIIREYKNFTLDGSCDMFIEGATFGLVDDWKTKTQAKLKEAAAGKLESKNRIQIMTYGLGWALKGHNVTHVVIYSLPRDGALDDAKPVLMRWDPTEAIERLALIDNLIETAEIMDGAFPGLGWEKVILSQDRAGHCFDCEKYEKLESDSFLSNLTGN